MYIYVYIYIYIYIYTHSKQFMYTTFRQPRGTNQEQYICEQYIYEQPVQTNWAKKRYQSMKEKDT
jgi:hypothetical protein